MSEPVSARLAIVLDLLAADHRSLSSVRDPKAARQTHIADSLSALELPEMAGARAIIDIGAGAGFPGIPLADALPAASVQLLDSVSRKCAFMREALAASGIENASVVEARAEDWAIEAAPLGGREAYDVVTARAVGRLATLAELASPLLAEGGHLIAWKGRRDPDEEAELSRAEEATAMKLERVHDASASSGFEHRHLYVMAKSGATPGRLPRRAGMAKKRPPGSSKSG